MEPTRVLCVDDEPYVLSAITRSLRRDVEIVTAPGAAEGLAAIGQGPPFAVVISDLRMPVRDGISFLQDVRQIAPDTVRMLLTGAADMDLVIEAVNLGNIFQFLTKPIAPEALARAVAAAAEQYRLVTSERVLLEETLQGSITALTDVLSLVHPMAFGRATRIKRHVATLAAELKIAERWPIEVAAMLSQVGCITLAPALVQKLYHGRPLTAPEKKLVDPVPQVAQQLIARIPRLEAVRDILGRAGRRHARGVDAGRRAPPATGDRFRCAGSARRVGLTDAGGDRAAR